MFVWWGIFSNFDLWVMLAASIKTFTPELPEGQAKASEAGHFASILKVLISLDSNPAVQCCHVLSNEILFIVPFQKGRKTVAGQI